MPAERRVDARLAHQMLVEPEIAPVRRGDGVAEDAIGRARARVHADEQRRVAALLEQFGVTRPRVMRHPFTVRIEQFGNEGIEIPPAARAVTIDHHDLLGAGGLGAAHRRVDFLGVKSPAFVIERRTAGDLFPDDDAAHPFHVRHDQHAHDSRLRALTCAFNRERGIFRSCRTWPASF